MATALTKQNICNIVKYGTLVLQTKTDDGKPWYTGIVVMREKLLVTDFYGKNLQIFNRYDGKLNSTSDELKFIPMGVCIVSDTDVAVCLKCGKIKILSIGSNGGVKRVKTINVRKELDECDSVTKWKSHKLIVSGWKDGSLSLVVVSIKHGLKDSFHYIIKGYDNHMTVKGNTVYVSCWAGDSIANGVYAFDILNPHKPKFLYHHQELKKPWSIFAYMDYVYVCDMYSSTIHQLTDRGQLMTIHSMLTSPYEIFYDDQDGVLYTTSRKSNIITLYKMENPHQAEFQTITYTISQA